MSTVVFGIKNCDTVKKARKWLEQHDIAYEFADFREAPPKGEQIRHWINNLGLDTLINKRSTTYRQLDTQSQQSRDPETWVTLVEHQPTLIKRPLLQHQSQLHCGFNDSRYKEIFNV